MMSIGVEILRKRDVRDCVLLPSAVVYDSEGLISLELRCKKLFAHVKLQGGYSWRLLQWMKRDH
jgi:hypothetical protein